MKSQCFYTATPFFTSMAFTDILVFLSRAREFFSPSASSSAYWSLSHLFRTGSAGIRSPLEDLWEWTIFNKIHFLLLEHERVIYHLNTFAKNNWGLLPSTQFFYTNFHTKIFQMLALLIRFSLPCVGSFRFWCVLVVVLSSNACSVKTQESSEGWQRLTAMSNWSAPKVSAVLSHPFVTGTILNVVSGWSYTSLKESLVLEDFLFFTVCWHSPWSSHLFVCGNKISRFKC